jgi:MYXO-CTERM domain-containing protein
MARAPQLAVADTRQSYIGAVAGGSKAPYACSMLFGARGRGRVGSALALGLAAAALGFGGCTAAPTEETGSSESAIVGGKLDTTHKAVVSLLREVPEGYYPACSGTLITRNLVLTAHHCVARLDSDDGQSVECGETRFGQTTPARELIISVEANVGQEGINPFQVAQVWLPPGTNTEVCGNDIAMLLLSGSGVPPTLVTPIEPRLANEIGADDEFSAIGYGLQDPDDQYGETAGQRMAVSGASVFCTGSSCGSELVAHGEWIADSPVCSGDSGGPALDQNGRVAGVTSRGDPDCTVGIYTSTYAWRDFITDSVFDAAEAGHYTPPAWAGEPPPGFDPGVPPAGGSAGMTGSGGTPSTPTGGASPTLAGSGNLVSGGNNSGNSPVVDPLGLACTGNCPGSYACWTESGTPPGICVPLCGPMLKECPQGYECSTIVNACVPEGKIQRTPRKSSGCSVSGTGSSSPAALGWLGLMGALVLLRSRRR